MKARLLVGRNLRRLRVAQGVSHGALGLAAGCEPSYVGRIERGRENPSVDLLELLTKTLNAGVIELFEPLDVTSAQANLRPGRKRRRTGESAAAPQTQS